MIVLDNQKACLRFARHSNYRAATYGKEVVVQISGIPNYEYM